MTSTILTVQTLHAQNSGEPFAPVAPLVASLVPLWLVRRRRSWSRAALFFVAAGVLLAATACGDRVSTAGQTTPAKPYTLTISATATNAAGGTLQHNATVTLDVQ